MGQWDPVVRRSTMAKGSSVLLAYCRKLPMFWIESFDIAVQSNEKLHIHEYDDSVGDTLARLPIDEEECDGRNSEIELPLYLKDADKKGYGVMATKTAHCSGNSVYTIKHRCDWLKVDHSLCRKPVAGNGELCHYHRKA